MSFCREGGNRFIRMKLCSSAPRPKLLSVGRMPTTLTRGSHCLRQSLTLTQTAGTAAMGMGTAGMVETVETVAKTRIRGLALTATLSILPRVSVANIRDHAHPAKSWMGWGSVSMKSRKARVQMAGLSI